MRKGFFLVLEGPDLSGKSTQAALLVRRIRRHRRVIHTREPGGTPLAERVRALLLDIRSRVDPLAELLLYEAARAQHVRERVEPALKSGAVVVCERFTMATEAYQGYGRGLPLPLIRRLNMIATGGLRPDLTVLIAPPEASLRRRSRGKKDRLEREPAGFAKRVRTGYRRLARGPKVALVDAAGGPEEVADAVWERVRRTLRVKAS